MSQVFCNILSKAGLHKRYIEEVREKLEGYSKALNGRLNKLKKKEKRKTKNRKKYL